MPSRIIKSNPCISVVMPAYNAETTIAPAIESILHQTFSDFEFIIVNDGSTDRTSEIINSFCKKDKRIKVITNKKNNGCYPSRNIGMSVAKGEYVAVMDADDISLAERLDKQQYVLDNSPNLLVLGGNAIWVNGEHRQKILTPNGPYAIQWNLLLRNNAVINASSMLRRKEILSDFNGYPENFSLGQDRAFFLDISFTNPQAISNLEDVIYEYRRRRDSLSQNPEVRQEKRNATLYHIRPYYEEIIGQRISQQDFFTITYNTYQSISSNFRALLILKTIFKYYQQKVDINAYDINFISTSYNKKRKRLIMAMIKNTLRNS